MVDIEKLPNPSHRQLASALRLTEVTDFVWGILRKGVVTRDDYDEAYRQWVRAMAEADFVVEDLCDKDGFYIVNYAAPWIDALHHAGHDPTDVVRMREEADREALRIELEVFLLVECIFQEQHGGATAVIVEEREGGAISFPVQGAGEERIGD